MKPLIIFQLPCKSSDPRARCLTDIIIEGVEKGALIVDSTITVLSFDEEGRLNYCTEKEPLVAEAANE